MFKRRETRVVKIGNVFVGSGHPVSIQSMLKTDTLDVASAVSKINRLADSGCEIVRVAVKDAAAAEAISSIKSGIGIPLVADIHFDHKLAVLAARSGADKIRINPGNINGPDDVARVIDECGSRGIPIRIGVNSGSIAQDAAGASVADMMVDSTLRYLEFFRKKKFNDIVISLKASEVTDTVEAYRNISVQCDYPLHLGVTAAGSMSTGMVKSAMGIGALLIDGIGDTIRVSLTGGPGDEIEAAKKILSASGTRFFGPEVISCPACGRCGVDLAYFAGRIEEELEKVCPAGTAFSRRFTVAVMGCEVNGPGEAGNADVGIAFGKNKGAIFRRGEIVRTVSAGEATDVLMDMIRKDLAR